MPIVKCTLKCFDFLEQIVILIEGWIIVGKLLFLGSFLVVVFTDMLYHFMSRRMTFGSCNHVTLLYWSPHLLYSWYWKAMFVSNIVTIVPCWSLVENSAVVKRNIAIIVRIIFLLFFANRLDNISTNFFVHYLLDRYCLFFTFNLIVGFACLRIDQLNFFMTVGFLCRMIKQ